MPHSVISLGLGLGGGKASTSSGRPGGSGYNAEFSLHFDGTDDYLNIPHDSTLTMTGDMSFSAWVNRTELVNASAGGYVPILTKRGSNINYQFYLDSLDGSGAGRMRFYDGSSAHSPSGGTVIAAAAWFHVALTIDNGATNGGKWYVNGELDGAASTISVSNTNTDPVMVGKLGNAAYYTKGLTDEVALFDSILSVSDITAIYNSGSPADLTSFNPVSWWRMGEGATWDGSNWTIPDASPRGNGNAGTTANMAEGSRSTNIPS